MWRLIDGYGYTSQGIPRGVWLDVQSGLTTTSSTTTITATYYIDSGWSLFSNEIANYYVISRRAGQNSEPTPIISVGGPAAQPEGVTLSSSTGADDGYITVSWGAANGATSYEVSRITTNPMHLNWEIVGVTSLLTMEDQEFLVLSTGSVISSYRVRGINLKGEYSAYSQVVSVNSHRNSKTGQADMSALGSMVDETLTSYSLGQNFPNPFNPSTTISYAIPQDGSVSLKVYDMAGHEILTLVDGYKSAGRYNVQFDASNLSSGIYIYKIQAGAYSVTKKMQLVK